MSFPRLAGLGALAASLGLLALFALFVLWTRPGVDSGLNWSSVWVLWISVGGIIAALVAVHVVYGRQLLEMAKHPEETRTRP
jgi:hypothetical protein